MRLCVADGWRRFRLIKRVTSLVLLAHPIDNEHDDRNGKNEANNSQSDAY